jgi:putative tricarboxylic transport membrane protein
MENLLLGLQTAIQPENVLAVFVGVFVGTAIGVIPGIGPLAAIALLMPVTFSMDPTTGIVLLAGVYYGAEYGGSKSSILLNLPGTPAAAITCLEGYPMAQSGQASRALFLSTFASFVGGLIGMLVVAVLTPAIVAVAQAFGPAEYFALIVFCFVAVSTVGGSDPKKNFVMVLLGALLATVGLDIYDGAERFTFGSEHLIEGIHLVPVAMGLFGFSEIILSIRRNEHQRIKHRVDFKSMMPTLLEWRRSFWPMIRGAASGCFFGPLPGTGPSMATILSYAVEKKLCKYPGEFGSGAVEGVAGPESANNAAAQSAFVPTLSLGIPGTPTMAVMIGALMIHGIVPGPLLMNSEPVLFWGLVASFGIGNLAALIINVPLIGLWVSFLNVSYRLLYPAVVILICVGCYSLRNDITDVVIMLVVGMVSYGLRSHGFAPAPLLIGFVLSPMLEENFRRAMIMAQGDMTFLIGSPISTVTHILAILLLFSMLFRRPLTAFFAKRITNGVGADV